MVAVVESCWCISARDDRKGLRLSSGQYTKLCKPCISLTLTNDQLQRLNVLARILPALVPDVPLHTTKSPALVSYLISNLCLVLYACGALPLLQMCHNRKRLLS
jgi:hypothetical protein